MHNHRNQMHKLHSDASASLFSISIRYRYDIDEVSRDRCRYRGLGKCCKYCNKCEPFNTSADCYSLVYALSVRGYSGI